VAPLGILNHRKFRLRTVVRTINAPKAEVGITSVQPW
jgi:hypothetical protein